MYRCNELLSLAWYAQYRKKTEQENLSQSDCEMLNRITRLTEENFLQNSPALKYDSTIFIGDLFNNERYFWKNCSSGFQSSFYAEDRTCGTLSAIYLSLINELNFRHPTSIAIVVQNNALQCLEPINHHLICEQINNELGQDILLDVVCCGGLFLKEFEGINLELEDVARQWTNSPSHRSSD
jgi:hypothetical protein